MMRRVCSRCHLLSEWVAGCFYVFVRYRFKSAGAPIVADDFFLFGVKISVAASAPTLLFRPTRKGSTMSWNLTSLFIVRAGSSWPCDSFWGVVDDPAFDYYIDVTRPGLAGIAFEIVRAPSPVPTSRSAWESHSGFLSSMAAGAGYA